MSIAKAGDTPLTLAGDPVKVGDTAPDFTIQLNDMSDMTLATHAGKTRIFCPLLSLDTGVCDAEMKRFNDDFASVPNSVVVCVSMDLPMTQARWCGASGADNIVTASDHRSASFGQAYGCLVKGGKFDRTLYRAVFVVGPDDKVKHVEYVSDLGSQPNFEAALAAAT